MAYDLVVAGASRSARRWDHFATKLPQKHDTDKEWDKVGKSASVLAVCAVLILNAAIALPFNVAARYNEQPKTRVRILFFRGFLAFDAVAFLSSSMATISCTCAGFASVGNLRATYLYFGAICLMFASILIVGSFALGMYAAFTTGLYIFPITAAVLFGLGILGVIVRQFEQSFLNHRALRARLGTTALCSSLLGDNRRMYRLFLLRNFRIKVLGLCLVVYCIYLAIAMLL